MRRRGYGNWPEYVSTADKKQITQKEIAKLKTSGAKLCPVKVEGRKIAATFWGKGWCEHLESFSDYANRLPRGRTYVRSGMVCHLVIEERCIEALVRGRSLYNVTINIENLPDEKWAMLKKQCAGQIGSLLELLQGKLSDQIMAVVTNRENGIFPLPGEINLCCDCPDWAEMCKHIAAVLYGVGKRLDEKPELLFLLRGVNLDELITAGAEEAFISDLTGKAGEAGARRRVSTDQLEDIFGIELDDTPAATVSPDYAKGIITGKEVAALRKSLDLSPKDFARLLKVSTATIYNWEKTKGPLKLHDKSRKALIKASAMKR